ncbi:hypothetical protein [Demequina soli]|uniref:hypothetical protein n=1 Tax=Demequina soli TaxID=1638987 RepID=UPI0007834C20|nr:hypothetical protein [Demequina soli]
MSGPRAGGPLSEPVVAAWIATAVDIPLYTLAAALCVPAGAWVWGLLGGASPGRVDTTEAATLVATALIVAVGIASVAQTVGRWLHVRTLGVPRARSARSFATMGGLLGLIPAAVIVAIAGSAAAIPFALIAVVLPCTVVAAATNVLLPRVAASLGAVTAFAVVAVICFLGAVGVLVLFQVTGRAAPIAD